MATSGAETGRTRLREWYERADETDRRDGAAAYWTYFNVISRFASHYGFRFSHTLAAFVALSPNSDYWGNLRSLAGVLAAARAGDPVETVTVSTYNHCRDRAYSYALGTVDFMSTVKGQKIRSFYQNIFDPQNPQPVTIDGHMYCAWLGVDRPMKEAIVPRNQYEDVAADFRAVAGQCGLLPNQLQAIIWLTRKRINRIMFTAQYDLFRDHMDVLPFDIVPYPRKVTK